jgi:hypothetical protein
MPAHGVSSRESATDRDASVPKIELADKGLMRHARVINVTQSTGITPGTAEVAISNVKSVDEEYPVTLGRHLATTESGLPYGSRILIKQDAITIFCGSLTDRVESSRSGITTLNYSDYRVQMGKIPLVGCWVVDPYTGDVTWTER